MPRSDNEVRITPSVLDRLLDYEPEVSREPAASRAKSLRQLKQAVVRDLEWLLNTRYVRDEISGDLPEVNRSLIVYGLPDFSHISLVNKTDRERLRRALEFAIRTFEPRMENVIVTFENESGEQAKSRAADRALHFRINARLRVEPAPEPVTFDTVLQLGSGEYKVQGE